MIYWLLLLVTIVFEVAGTVSMKLSDGLTKGFPSLMIFVNYGICFSIFAIVVKKIDLSIAYALWSGLGTLFVTLISVWLFKEQLNLIQVFCIVAIVAGVVGLKLTAS
ncbi:QacE family quaternary ammonium compound efflux SMR transporter [Bacillaceae bacterium SAOS 7]|nr:QacE family quaternary ammonium compound efflux SMR transporter [Bacillaceae bacterium SAOS 7]